MCWPSAPYWSINLSASLGKTPAERRRGRDSRPFLDFAVAGMVSRRMSAEGETLSLRANAQGIDMCSESALNGCQAAQDRSVLMAT